MDWSEFFISFIVGFVAGWTAFYFTIVYFQKSHMKFLENRRLQNRIDSIEKSQVILHQHRSLIYSEISKIYDKLEKQKGKL